MGDQVGSCLFFFLHYEVFKMQESLSLAHSLLNHIASYRYALHSKHTYCSGVSGIAWFLQYLERNEFIELEKDFFSDIDRTISSLLSEDLQSGNYDFLHGALGAFYTLLTKKNKSEFYDSLDKAVDDLFRIKKIHIDTYYWTFYNALHKEPEYGKADFGLSHGIPSIISLLSKYYIERKNVLALDLIEKACAFLLTARNPEGMYASSYPYNVTIDSPSPMQSRLGWCYGDLGIALSFWHAYRATNDAALKTEALRIMDKCCYRLNSTVNDVRDAALCHGSSGVAQIFRRFYVLTGEEKFRHCSDYWISQTLDFMMPTADAPNGKIRFDPKIGYTENHGLLEGLSGIGLALLSSISKENLSWDEVLLIS